MAAARSIGAIVLVAIMGLVAGQGEVNNTESLYLESSDMERQDVERTRIPCCRAVSIMVTGPPPGSVCGTLEFVQPGGVGPVTITGQIRNLPPNSVHGIHIHEFGDFRNPANPCDSTGEHWNPLLTVHGGPLDLAFGRHTGDLGNIVANCEGVATVAIVDRLITLAGRLSIVGRAITVHALPDDYGRGAGTSLIDGNSGPRIACGLIGVVHT